jgi:hypothetical protein
MIQGLTGRFKMAKTSAFEKAFNKRYDLLREKADKLEAELKEIYFILNEMNDVKATAPGFGKPERPARKEKNRENK